MPSEHIDNYSIIPHTRLPLVLLLREEQGWSLPHHHSSDPKEVNAAMKEQLGLTTTVLFCAYDRYPNEEREDEHLVFALDNHSPATPLPANARWVSRSELANLPLALPEHRPVLETWFAEVEDGQISELRVPWMRLGWFDSATAWIGEQLERLGYTKTAPVEQLVSRPWAAVLRVPTSKGYLYFKVPSPVFAFEPELTETLHQLVPTFVPGVLVRDRQRNWMLMRDAGIPLRDMPPTLERLEIALRRFAEMQIELAEHVETLKATGCPDRRLHLLPHLYQEILAATPFLLIDEPNGLPRSEHEQLLALAPQLQEICHELASYRIPESLHHFDLHNGNILYNGETYVFIDAGEYCLGHPFSTMFIVLRVARYILEYDEQMLGRLVRAYLEPWTRYEPMEHLRRIFELAHRLGSLYKALSWYDVISQLEPCMRWMHADMALYYLRVFLGTEE
ncbi:MAG TPA: phosphotransferase [Ktedonobacteraceae bacterium]|jgi:hypothetical protein|nr:phosphotransferase [Ktedonobacteraceae bacterium]